MAAGHTSRGTPVPVVPASGLHGGGGRVGPHRTPALGPRALDGPGQCPTPLPGLSRTENGRGIAPRDPRAKGLAPISRHLPGRRKRPPGRLHNCRSWCGAGGGQPCPAPRGQDSEISRHLNPRRASIVGLRGDGGRRPARALRGGGLSPQLADRGSRAVYSPA